MKSIITSNTLFFKSIRILILTIITFMLSTAGTSQIIAQEIMPQKNNPPIDDNNPPVIISTSIATATQDILYTYDFEATDSDEDDVLTYSLATAPDGMTIDADTGLIQWTPTKYQTGYNYVKVQVINEDGNTDTQFLAITVADVNDPLVITSTPISETTVGALYTYDVEAEDPDVGDVLTYSLTTAPDGMTIDAATGLIKWTTTSKQLGNNDVMVRVEDSEGLFDTQSFTIMPQTDLIISDVDNNVLVFDGQTLTVSGDISTTVTNISLGDVTIPFDVLFFEDLDWNGEYDASVDNDLGSVTVTEKLSSGDSTTITGSLAGSVQFSGALIWGFVDSQNAIKEIDERNNLAHSSFNCQFIPSIGSFDPVVEWSWTSSQVLPDWLNVMMTPGIIDLNDDEIPDVIFSSTSSRGGGFVEAGVLRALSGHDGAELFTVTEPKLRVNTTSSVAIGDIDLDGKPEIIACDSTGRRLMVFEHDGTFKWRSPNLEAINWGAPCLADLDGDVTPEIVIGRQALNNDGTIRWTGTGGRGTQSAGPLSLVADIDMDGSPDVVAGNTAYTASGNILWKTSLPDGYNAIGNFDDDMFPEIVLVSGGKVHLLEHDGTVKWGPVNIPKGGSGGPPTVADYDNDGEVEIGVASARRYAVFETDGSLKWAAATQDKSSNITGSSVFDFDGDGSAEVVYQDELKLRIYRGTDGTVLFQTPMSSCTWHEYPLVADVDADGNAEIVTVANNNCGHGRQRGIYVIGDANDTWVPTRQIWNQHTYHITNVNDDGTIPTVEANSWESHNTYRLNFQTSPGGPQSAPNLIPFYVRFSVEGEKINFIVRIGNGGAVLVGPNIDIAFYNGAPAADGVLLGVAQTKTRIVPGAFEDVSISVSSGEMIDLWVSADDNGNGKGKVNECNEVNNLYHYPLDNHPPEITSKPVTEATVNEKYTYDVEATDIDNDPLIYSLTTFPEGMIIDDRTGLIQWTPTIAQVGSNDVVVQVDDGRDGSDTQDFIIHVEPNNPPVITSDPGTKAAVGFPYMYDVDATDVDNDPLTFSLSIFPEGMTIDAKTGLIQWTPTETQVGENNVFVQVDDDRGGTAAQSFTITVDGNNPPEITSVPATKSTVGKLYTYDVDATDADNAPLTYGLTTFPEGMTIDAKTGLIQWTPTEEQVGENKVVVQVDDGNGGVDTQEFTITVEPKPSGEDYIRPEVDVTVAPTEANVGESVTIAVNAKDNVDVTLMTLMVNGEDVLLDDAGKATYSSSEPGVFTAVGTALDEAGNEGLDKAEFEFIIPGDTTPPTVAISSPEDNSKLSVPTDIIGTVSDDTKLISYKLEYSVKGKNEFITFTSGTSPITDGVLGKLDSTTMKNGLYDVKLTAKDASGNTASTTRTYQLEGEMKVGNFTISFNDLTIPVAGIPITITRTYDSRVKTKGDFGVGWTLDIKNIELSESAVPGEDWEQKSGGGGLSRTYFLQPTKSHTIIVTFPDGRTDEFEMEVSPNSSRLVPIKQTTASFVAKQGTFSSLIPLDVSPVNLWVMVGEGEVELLDWSDFMPFDSNRYQLTAIDGTVYIINQQIGLERIKDTNGNTITFDANGIIHSADKSVTFARDKGRITTITDPMGNTIQYEYDYYGDLVSVTDQEGNTTRFTYNSSHGLVDIIDPRGITPARNEYDDEGRLTAIIDADGNRVEFTHNIGTRQEVVRDRLGNVTVYEYDDDGNVVSQTDALGNTTSYTYDARGNKLSETDPLGNTTTCTYDAQDNMLSQTDSLGNTTSYTCNSRGQVLTTTDPEGNVTTNAYDANGNLTSITDPLGNVTMNTYDAAGNLTSTTDALGNVMSYTYDTAGNMISQTDPLGNVTTYTYDANGN